jgi:acetyl-CoA carboxylase biotin carboxyl carrier protein
MLSFKEIKELIALVSEKRLAGVEIERAGFRIRIEGVRASGNGVGASGVPLGPSGYVVTPEISSAAPPLALASRSLEPPEEAEDLHFINSPIVGTFYRAPSPEADAFVKVGDHVEKGKILCIIEAMKLMNEIESDVSGEIVRVYPENGQPVEYGEKLFAIKPSA